MPETAAQDILDEIRRIAGFVPPFLEAAAPDADVLRNLWAQARMGYLENPVPAMFKEKFLAIMARWNLTPYCLVMRSCMLSGLGMSGAKIVELLKTRLPRQAQITERIRIEATRWQYKSGWSNMPAELEYWVLWAAVRVTLRKDPGGRCRSVLREVLSEATFNHLVLLGAYAVMQRLWIDSHPELDVGADVRVQNYRDGLLAEAPAIADLWARLQRRGSTGVAPHKNRRLVAEIARQDRIREALRESERRFRRVVQSVPFPVMVYAEDGQIMMLNRAWTDQSGWTLKQTSSIQEWLRKAEHSDQPWEASDIRALYGWHEVIEEGEQRITTASGQTRSWDFYSASVGRLPDGRQAIMRVAVDVTERARLEGALWDTNRRVLNILESITDGFVALDRDMRFQYVNRRGEEMLKLTRGDMMGRLFTEVFPYVCETNLYQAMERCLKNHTTEHVDYYSGRLGTYFEVHLYPSEEGLSAYICDISQRKQMDEQLRASERRFRGLFESDMLGVMFANRFTGAILDCNDALLRITGYSREDLQEGRMSWKALTPPEYQHLDEAAVEPVGRGPLVPYEKEYIHKDGHRVPILIGGAPVVQDEEVVMAYIIDRTREKEAERQNEESRRLFNAIIRASPMAIVLVDEQNNVTLWNPAAEQLFGWTEAEVLGRPYPLPTPEGQERFRRNQARVLAGESLFDHPAYAMTRDHGRRAVKINACPVRDTDGRILAVMTMLMPDPECQQWTGRPSSV